eukprot:15130879-Ditylum_brightwellii.AAC.1
MADMNSPIGSYDIGEFLVEIEMIYLIGHCQGLSNVNSHISSSKQIDLIFGTKKIANAVTKGGILPFHMYITAYHWAIYTKDVLEELQWKPTCPPCRNTL